MTNDYEVIANPSGSIAAGLYGLFTLRGIFAAVTAAAPLQAALFAAAAVAFAVLTYRAAKSRLEVDNRGVTAKTDRFTRHLNWDDVEHFEFRGRTRLPPKSGDWGRCFRGPVCR
ncbi:MAG: PH domain-containing protein [Actinomycetota bacterium]|nr:PH domain-containing protein [Actinomycetota bacterium]MDQ6946372.1 PH domain-containing protein [Actinomycetota bacterium]